jgi:hypothetical protein
MFVGVPRATTSSAPDVQVSAGPQCYHPPRWAGVREFHRPIDGKASAWFLSTLPQRKF